MHKRACASPCGPVDPPPRNQWPPMHAQSNTRPRHGCEAALALGGRAIAGARDLCPSSAGRSLGGERQVASGFAPANCSSRPPAGSWFSLALVAQSAEPVRSFATAWVAGSSPAERATRTPLAVQHPPSTRDSNPHGATLSDQQATGRAHSHTARRASRERHRQESDGGGQQRRANFIREIVA